jgi:hypothetical protein
MAKGLKQNALSIVDTVTLAVAGTAPSYSLNATTAALVAAVGLASPGALLYGAIPMFGIAFSFIFVINTAVLFTLNLPNIISSSQSGSIPRWGSSAIETQPFLLFKHPLK